jgi:hypothetical protein
VVAGQSGEVGNPGTLGMTTDRVTPRVPWYPTSREKRARCGAPERLLPVQEAGHGVSMRDRLRGSQVSKARPGAPFAFTLRFYPYLRPSLSTFSFCWALALFRARYGKSDCWASPRFPVYLVGVGEPHAAFLNESRTRGRWWRPVAGNPGRPSFSAHVRLGERGAPVPFPLHFLWLGWA